MADGIDLSSYSTEQLQQMLAAAQPVAAVEPKSFGRTLAEDSTGGLLNILNAATLGGADELAGGGAALIDALRGGNFSDSFAARQSQVGDLIQGFRDKADTTPYLGRGAKYLVDLSAGAAIPIGEGLSAAKGVFPKLLEALKLGVGIGGTSGFLSSDGGLVDRSKGAGLGALLGAATSPVVALTSQAADDLSNAFSPITQKQQALDVIKEAAGETGMGRVMSAAPEDIATPYGNKTFTEVAQTPGSANLEMQMRKEMGPGNLLLDSLEQRQAARAASLERIPSDAGQDLTNDVRGSLIRESALAQRQPVTDATDALWKLAKSNSEKIDATGGAKEVSEFLANRPTVRGYSSDAKKIVKRFQDLAEEGPLSIENWQMLRSEAGDLMSEASASGSKKDVSLMRFLRENLDKAADKAAETGSGKVAVNNLQNAIAATRSEKELYESGVVGDVLHKRIREGFTLRESLIPEKLIATPEAAKQTAATFGKNEDVMMRARGTLLDKMIKRNPENQPQFFDKYRPQFKAIFGDDFMTVKNYILDIESQNVTGELAQAGTGKQSFSTQGVTTLKFLENRMRSLLPLGVPNMGEMSTKKIQGFIAQMLADPRIAKEYAKGPSENLAQLVLRKAVNLTEAQTGPEAEKLIKGK